MSRRLFLQVTGPAVLIGVAMVGVCLGSLWSIHRLQSNLTSILAGSAANLDAASDLEEKLRQLRLHTFLYVMDPTPGRLEALAKDEADVGAALAIVRRTGRPEDADLLTRIMTGYDRYLAERPRPSDLAGGPWSREAYLAWADTHPVQPILDDCDELIVRDRQVMEETAAEGRRVGDRTRTAMTALTVLGPLGGLVAGFGIARGLSRSIAKLQVRVEDVRAQLGRDVGTVRVSVGGLGGLDAELAHVVARVREVVEQAQQRERDALRAEQLAAVGQLAAGVAHEVRNPLMSMKLLTESALAGGEMTPDDLRVINDQIGRLEQTVTGLLDFARPTPPRRTVVDLRGVVSAAVDLVRGRADLQNVRLEVTAPPDPVPAAVDVSQLTGVLVNLLLNALDALPGGGRIGVAVTHTAENEVSLTVTDTGPGIAPAVLARLFEPFVSTKDTGTGLGLNVCRRVARDHGGAIRGENVPGGGARFTVTLPGGADAEAPGH